MEVKREPGDNEFEGNDHREEEEEGRYGYDIVGVLEEYEGKRVLHAKRVSHLQSMKEKHA